MLVSRRSFLALPFVASVSACPRATTSGAHRFEYEHVMGTSLDLAVWTSAPHEAAAAERAVLDEIDRLLPILSTYDSASEISRFARAGCRGATSADLDAVLRAYEMWEQRSSGSISCRLAGGLNVDALGKAYVVDRAAEAARRAAPNLDGLLLNVGGDLIVRGRSSIVSVADPFAPDDNAVPLTALQLTDAAVATSGTYARGCHIVDPYTGRPAREIVSATVVATDCVAANALATALVLRGAEGGRLLVEGTPGAGALVVARSGEALRIGAFGRLERPIVRSAAAAAAWPAGYELTIAFTLTGATETNRFFGRRRVRRPYVAVWVEDLSGRLVKILALWGESLKYLQDLPSLWAFLAHNVQLLFSVSRVTRDAGRYSLVWNGLDESGKAVPDGAYRIVIETNQQDGDYAKQSGTIACGAAPARLDLKPTVNFEDVQIQYGPRASA
jgi:thiamine biosynthesis lipoprotein